MTSNVDLSYTDCSTQNSTTDSSSTLLDIDSDNGDSLDDQSQISEDEIDVMHPIWINQSNGQYNYTASQNVEEEFDTEVDWNNLSDGDENEWALITKDDFSETDWKILPSDHESDSENLSERMEEIRSFFPTLMKVKMHSAQRNLLYKLLDKELPDPLDIQYSVDCYNIRGDIVPAVHLALQGVFDQHMSYKEVRSKSHKDSKEKSSKCPEIPVSINFLCPFTFSKIS